MHSTVELYNVALARLGGNQLGRINTPYEDSTEAALCDILFPHAVDLALAALPWNFATRRVALALQKEHAGGEYPFRYALPVDCLSPIRLEGCGDGGFPPVHVIEGRSLLCAQNPATLVYVARLLDVTSWPPAFSDAVAWLLAAELATSLINDGRRQQFYLQKYEQALLEARAVELRQQRFNRPSGPWLEARTEPA